MSNTIAKSSREEEKTSYFDLDKKSLPDGVKCTLYSLCKEIATNSKQGTCDTLEDVYKKFTNDDGSGVIDHLRNDLGFEVDEYDKFQKYQFLKMMYRYEKDKSENSNAFQITKVLKRPRVENIKSPYYGAPTLYGENFEELLTELESIIGKEEAEERKRTLVLRNQRWNNVLSNMMRLSFEEEALKKENFEVARQELIVIKNFLNEKIYDKLETPTKHKPVDNIFMAFYTLLIEHMMLCEEEDRLVSYNSIELYESAEDDYITSFVEWEQYVMPKEIQEQILDNLIKYGTCPFDISGNRTRIVDMRYLIFRKNEKLDNKDISALRLTRKYLDKLRKWVRIQKPTETPEDSLLASWFIAIVQEVVYCKINHITVKNDAYGVEEKRRTLTATLKSADKAEAKHIQEWMIRIENRYAADIGGIELLAIAREIELVFEKIRRWALQHHDLSDFIFVDNALVHTVERMVVPRFIAKNNLDEFATHLQRTGIIEKVFYYKTVGLFNLGREMELDKSMMERLVDVVQKKKKIFDKSTLFKAGYKEYIQVHYEQYDEDITYLFMYSFDREGIMYITFFRPVEADEIINQYASYGLGQLGITG
ncbi:hypothetical protein ACTM9N_03065 [Lachnospiraceae bacterium HCP1S3_A8]